MDNWCTFADQKPLAKVQTQRVIGKPRIFIIHTMSGYLMGTDATFRPGGYAGVESHFGIGGSYDPQGMNGRIVQWTPINRSADAQFEGNAYATSVETSDGAHSGVPWSVAQAEAIIKLGVWWCQQTGNPPKIVSSPNDSGFGWHSQFQVWNKNSHDCPGAVRLRQYREQIVPEIARRISGGTLAALEPSSMIKVGDTYNPDFAKDAYPFSFIAIGAFAEAKRAKAAAESARSSADRAGKNSDALLTEVRQLKEQVAALTTAITGMMTGGKP